MKSCIIFNPAARGEKALKFRRFLEQLPGGWILKPTTGPGDARHLANEAIHAGFQTVVAAGGDGTLNEVLNGFGDVPNGFERARLGVIPLGTINVFARELRLPLDCQKAISVLDSASETLLDIGCAEFHSKGTEVRRYFIQLAGAGVDARSVELVNWELKKRIGPGAYVLAGLQAIGGPKSTVTIASATASASGELVLIGNGRLYGGTFPFFHKSDVQDGLLDAVIFEHVNWRTFPGHLWDFVRGKYFKEGGTVYLQAKEFSLTSSGPAPLQLEGDLVGELPATLTVLPRKLRVAVPQN